MGECGGTHGRTPAHKCQDCGSERGSLASVAESGAQPEPVVVLPAPSSTPQQVLV